MLKLLGYDSAIKYKKQVENKVAIQERPRKWSDCCNEISMVISAWVKEVEQSYKTDDKCLKLLQELVVAPSSKPKYSSEVGILR